VDRLLDDLRVGQIGEPQARSLTERIALATQAAILLQGESSAVAAAFVASRITTGAPAAFGVLPAALDHRALIGRVLR
jgi:putative acyl-CoA dehydrogenase